MTDRELMQQALDALNLELPSGAYLELKNALRDRLAQPEQEPVAWITKGGKGDLWWYRSVDENGNDNLDDVPLYMAPPQPVAKYSDIVSDGGLDPRNKFDVPPQRPWVGLTDEELSEVYNNSDWDFKQSWNYERAIEAKLKEKNT